MRSPRSVTMTPIGMPSRSLKLEIDFLALVMTGCWPVIVAMSSDAVSSALALATASPRPMFSVTFVHARRLHHVGVAELLHQRGHDLAPCIFVLQSWF